MTTKLRSQDYFLYKHFPLNISIGTVDGGAYPYHTHDFSELVLILSGSGIHRAGSERYPIQTGDVFCLPPDSPHGFENLKQLSLCNIKYHAKILALFESYLNPLPGYHALFRLEPLYREQNQFRGKLTLQHSQLLAVEKQLVALEQELKCQAPGFEACGLALFVELVTMLARAYRTQPKAEAFSFQRIADAVSHLQVAYPDKITLPQLAKKANMSANNFLLIFRKAFGTSPIHYLLQIRIRKACELLDDSDQTVTEIAFACGFRDSNYFTRAFQTVMAMSPRAFRRRHAALR